MVRQPSSVAKRQPDCKLKTPSDSTSSPCAPATSGEEQRKTRLPRPDRKARRPAEIRRPSRERRLRQKPECSGGRDSPASRKPAWQSRQTGRIGSEGSWGGDSPAVVDWRIQPRIGLWMRHAPRPAHKSEQIAAARPHKAPEFGEGDALGLQAPIGFDPPQNVWRAPGRQPVSASRAPEVAEHNLLIACRVNSQGSGRSPAFSGPRGSHSSLCGCERCTCCPRLP